MINNNWKCWSFLETSFFDFDLDFYEMVIRKFVVKLNISTLIIINVFRDV